METMTARKRSASKASTGKNTQQKAEPKKNFSFSYNQFKDYNGTQYTGMKIGRSHRWHYDKGDWKEKKITPDVWEISYAVKKRRAGKAPEGSGVPTGTEYHWYILAHQNVKKLNANDYSTSMFGLKYKLAHKRADKEKWSATSTAQRKRLIKFLQELITQLEQEPVPIEFEYKGEQYKGEGIPITQSCSEEVCYELDISLNDKDLGIIHCMKSGWKMDEITDQKFVNAIGNQIQLWYE